MPRQNTPPSDYPQAVLQQIEKLAQNIAIARKRRGESQAQWAKRLGISQPTMARIERGDPSVAMASYVMCMWLINPKAELSELIAPQNDHAALEKEVAKARVKRKPAAPRVAVSPAISAQAPIDSSSMRALREHPALQLSAAVKKMPAVQLAAAAQKLSPNPLAKALSPSLQALMSFYDSPNGRHFKAISDAAPGLAALMAKKPLQKP